MRVFHDNEQGFLEFHPNPTHDIPDAEWQAYRRLIDLANEMEDRFVADYAVEQVDEFADLRGVISDEDIEILRHGRRAASAGHDPANSPSAVGAVPTGPETPPRRYLSPEQAAAEIIANNRHKCQHRTQTGPYADGTVRCGQCGGILYGGTGIKRSHAAEGEHPEWYMSPEPTKPDDYVGNV